MTEANENIVKKYYELQGYLTYPNLKYTIHKGGSSGDSDIDLAIYHPITGDRAIIEVKGWHSQKFSKSYFEEEDDPDADPNTLYNFIRKEALDKANEFFGCEDYKKILVIPKLGPKQRNECIEIVKNRGVDEVLEFEKILTFVIDNVEPNKNYGDSEFLHTIRLLKWYGYIK